MYERKLSVESTGQTLVGERLPSSEQQQRDLDALIAEIDSVVTPEIEAQFMNSYPGKHIPTNTDSGKIRQ